MVRQQDVRLIGPPEAEGEFIGLRNRGGLEEIVHLHDYARLYAVPGLYECVVQDLLGCRSPQVAVAALARSLDRLGQAAADLRLLDLGAGTGLVGELARAAGVRSVIGTDALMQAREACLRDRPGVYEAYFVGDLAQSGTDLLGRLRACSPGGLVSTGAFGGGHAGASALAKAVDMLPAGAPVVFTINERWMRVGAPDGFLLALNELVGSGRLMLLERSRFEHRRTTSGESIEYELIVATVGSNHP